MNSPIPGTQPGAADSQTLSELELGENNDPELNTQLPNLQDSPGFERLIGAYLQKKGLIETFNKLEAENRDLKTKFTLRPEAADRYDASIIECLLESDKSFEPKAYFTGYSELRNWIDDSLELYKPELRAFLFPLFVHSYLELMAKGFSDQGTDFYTQYHGDHMAFHKQDIQSLNMVRSSQNVKENALAQLFRTNKYGIRVSKVGFELFISYLQDSQLMTLLRLINDHFAIKVVAAIPGTGELAEPVIGITGHSNLQLAKFNEGSLTLGHPPLSSDAKSELEQLLKEEDNQQKRKLSKTEGATYTSLLEQYKKYNANRMLGGYTREEIPLPPSKGSDVLSAIRDFKEIAHQVALAKDNKASASICMYTFHNTSSSLNTTTISNDLNLIAGGFSNSYIKLWSLKGDPLRSLRSNFNPTMVNDENDLERMREKNGSDSKRLVGHSGPVFGLSFSHDSKHLLSCSEDATIRLWNMDTYLNLVCYKGHNYPVWDVDFSPTGVYFASASHDRTARLWSCEHISPLRIFSGHLSDVDSVRFHPNSRYVVTGSSDKTARLWDISRGACVRVFTGHNSPIHTLALSPDGRTLASAGFDGSILIWDLGAGTLQKNLTLPEENLGTIHALTFSQDSKVLISGGADNTVRLWDLTLDTSDNPPPPLSSPALPSAASSPTLAPSTPPLLGQRELIASYPTRDTPILHLKCTSRNLILGAGCYLPPHPSTLQ